MPSASAKAGEVSISARVAARKASSARCKRSLSTCGALASVRGSGERRHTSSAARASRLVRVRVRVRVRSRISLP